MKALKKGFDFYIFSNIHVALSVLCLVELTLLDYQIRDHKLAFFVFFATILSYNLIRVFQLYKINSSVAAWIRDHKKSLIVLNVLSFFMMTFMAVSLRTRDFLFLLPFALLTLFYAIPLTYHFKGLRYVAGLKIFLIAFTWAGITVIFPLFSKELPYSTEIGLDFVQRFLFVTAITIPFDIRDTDFDVPELATLPQVVGIKTAKILALLALILFIGLDFLKPGVTAAVLSIDLILLVLSAFLIMGTRQKQSRYYTAFLVESLPVLWFVMRWFMNENGVI